MLTFGLLGRPATHPLVSPPFHHHQRVLASPQLQLAMCLSSLSTAEKTVVRSRRFPLISRKKHISLKKKKSNPLDLSSLIFTFEGKKLLRNSMSFLSYVFQTAFKSKH